jgi:hypothetical protein
MRVHMPLRVSPELHVFGFKITDSLRPRGTTMLKKCANPMCPNPFRVLSQGKLFQMEVDDLVACANRRNRLPRPRGALLALRPMLLLTHPNI